MNSQLTNIQAAVQFSDKWWNYALAKIDPHKFELELVNLYNSIDVASEHIMIDSVYFLFEIKRDYNGNGTISYENCRITQNPTFIRPTSEIDTVRYAEPVTGFSMIEGKSVILKVITSVGAESKFHMTTQQAARLRTALDHFLK